MRFFWERIRRVSRDTDSDLGIWVEALSTSFSDENPIKPSDSLPLRDWCVLAQQGLSPFDKKFSQVVPQAFPWPRELPVLKGIFRHPYLPIEALRDTLLGERLFLGASAHRTFRSSGTTVSSRSTSRYSAGGLEAYRLASLYTFWFVLQRVLGVNPDQVQGLSLIPTVSEWPDSSLAQMVGWISDVLPLSYVEPEGIANEVLQANDGDHSKRPVWLFATAFHLVDLIDRGLARPLPPGSVVIETGGTKGKTRSVSRDELYAMIEGSLGVPSCRIVSEYGMCELASQAYDFLDPQEVNDQQHRFFRFPAWVQLGVVSGVVTADAAGRGALLVSDPLRMDHPWPLRTEDLVNLELAGAMTRFRLLGRLDRAPLKGCSLLAEKVSSAELMRRPKGQVPDDVDKESRVDQPNIELDHCSAGLWDRATYLLKAMKNWQHSEILKSLTEELGSAAAGRAALDDVYKSLPSSIEALVAAALRSQGRGIPKGWLVILPRSHSLVGLYPLAMGYVLGLDLQVRIPTSLNHESSFIQKFVRLIQALPGASINITPENFRLKKGALPPTVQAILAYGEDHTIEELQRLADVPVHGFGGRTGLSILTAKEFEAQLPGLVRDTMALAQRGCMASRLALICDEQQTLHPRHVAKAVVKAFKDFWQTDVPWSTKVALDAEAFRLQGLGFNIFSDDVTGWPLIGIKHLDAESEFEDLGPETVARVPMTLPMVLIGAKSSPQLMKALQSFVAEWPSLASCSVSPELFHTLAASCDMVRRLGEANAPIWDGTHEGFPLFQGPVIS